MPILIGILIAIAVIIAVLVIVVAMQPTDFRIARSATISAPPAEVFGLVNDLHAWDDWSPWAKLDPAMKQTYEGPSAGTGAIYSWSGDSKAGEGRMTIIDSQPYQLIKIQLQFVRPFSATNDVEFTFKPEDGKTLVSWIMTGRNGLMGKAFSMLMNMDKMVGGDFEKGLASIKAIAEKTASR